MYVCVKTTHCDELIYNLLIWINYLLIYIYIFEQCLSNYKYACMFIMY